MLCKEKVKSESLRAKVEVLIETFKMYLQPCCHTGPQSKVSKGIRVQGCTLGKAEGQVSIKSVAHVVAVFCSLFLLSFPCFMWFCCESFYEAVNSSKFSGLKYIIIHVASNMCCG